MPNKYQDYLEINPLFESVVDIDADQRNKDLWKEYIVGNDMENMVECLCQSLGNESPDARRSFWVHGSFGTGKSYAGIFVKHLIEEPASVIDTFLGQNSKLSKFRKRFAKCRKNGDYLVVWKTGCTGIRSGDMMLIEAEKAIYDALIAKYGDKAYTGKASLIDAIKDKLDDPTINWSAMIDFTSLGDDYSSVEDLRQAINDGDLSAIQTTATVIRQRGFGLVNNLETFKNWIADIIDGNHLEKSGIFFIWDEFTEYVEHSDDHTVMQQLSEYCKVKPLFMLFIVHRSEQMVDSMGKDRYQMITHRFHQVEFHLTEDASLELIAGSINKRIGMTENWKEECKHVVKRIKPFLPEMLTGVDDKVTDMIEDLCPMHPMTIRLLSRVAESYAAAERTMFRFMKDVNNEDVGFASYIKNYGPDDEACWLTPDWLWDYFFTRESDFQDKETKVAEYIRHYEDCRHLTENDEDAHRIFKTAMLLLAVTSTTKGLFGGKKAHGGISATVDCLCSCMAGVIVKTKVVDLMNTLEESKVIVLDKAANDVIRIQLPFRTNVDDFQTKLELNDKKYSRYLMFSKEGAVSQLFEKQALDDNDAITRRIKLCVCCAETNSINTRYDEVLKELDKYPYKLGLLVVTVRDDAQYLSIQSDLQQRAIKADEPRLIIALLKNAFTDDLRKKWLTSKTKQELAINSGQTGAAAQYDIEAQTVLQTWVGSTVGGSRIIAWNGTQVYNNLYGMANLRGTVNMSVFQSLFPFAPENIVQTNTAYKSCNDAAPLAGITRSSTNAQLKNVLVGLGGLISITNIEELANVSGTKPADAIGHLAGMVRNEMENGAKLVLSDLWEKLQQPPFGYYDTIACGVLMGFVFSCYKDGLFSWTDNAQGAHALDGANLKTMVYNLVKGKMTTDYLSSGSKTFQVFREYVKSIMNLSDAQVAIETECWHNMREAVTAKGAPFWTLKYLPESAYGSVDFKDAAMKIVDQIQLYIQQDTDHENIMSNVLQLFTKRGKIKQTLGNSFQDKNVMNAAFRSFLFVTSPDLKQIADGLSIQPQELMDKIHAVMQGAIYTWTEEQVKEKLEDVIDDYRYLQAVNTAIGKKYHAIDDAKKDLANLFKYERISLAAVESLNKPWYSALMILYNISKGIYSSAAAGSDVRAKEIEQLHLHGKEVMDFLQDAKAVLSDILEKRDLDCTQTELETIYTGLKDMSCEATMSQFNKELDAQIAVISQARNRTMLKERWRTISGKETVKEWCTSHNAPIQWIVNKEQRKAIETLNAVLKNQRTLNQDVESAICALETISNELLHNDQAIEDAFIALIGPEYKAIFNTEKDQILIKAKMKIGNDMSMWDITDLPIVQQLLKTAQQEKAKKEKLANAKSAIQSMKEEALRQNVTAFLDAHPEFCDDIVH